MPCHRVRICGRMRLKRGPSRGIVFAHERRAHILNILSFAVLTCFVFALVVQVQFTRRHRCSPLRLPTAGFYNHSLEEPLDPNQRCRFPNLDPFDPSIRSHLSAAEPVRCDGPNVPDFVFVDDDGRLRVNRSALSETGYRWTSLSCDYQEVIRDDGDDSSVRFADPVPIERDGQELRAEFVYIRCMNFAGFAAYSGLHANVVRKRSLPDRAVPASRPNVMFLVLDSTSRSNFVRQLPDTYRYLVADLGAVELRGLTKVGENTFPNIVPLLTGLQTSYYAELEPFSNRSRDWPGFRQPASYDDWPFVWGNFSAAGYATLMAEDVPGLSIFNYMKGGFDRPPADHYMRPFWLALESSELRHLSSYMCLGPRPKHQLPLDYLRRFAKTYRNVPHFGLCMLTEISHDHMNQLGAADADFHRFLVDLQQQGSLDNTFLVVMGDHGHRLSSIVETAVGSAERRLPFAAVYLPPWFRAAFPAAVQHLRDSGRRLTSMRDFYFTLLDLLEYARSGTGIGRHVQAADGTTLFGPIPASRGCPQAGVPNQFCACDEERSVPPDHPGVPEAAAGLVAAVNAVTAPHRELCAAVELVAIRFALLLGPQAAAGGELRFRIAVEVGPSGGLFEGLAVVRAGEPPRIMDGIIRMNAYGGQSGCLPQAVSAGSAQLRGFCYCPGYS